MPVLPYLAPLRRGFWVTDMEMDMNLTNAKIIDSFVRHEPKLQKLRNLHVENTYEADPIPSPAAPYMDRVRYTLSLHAEMCIPTGMEAREEARKQASAIICDTIYGEVKARLEEMLQFCMMESLSPEMEQKIIAALDSIKVK